MYDYTNITSLLETQTEKNAVKRKTIFILQLINYNHYPASEANLAELIPVCILELQVEYRIFTRIGNEKLSITTDINKTRN